MAERQGVQIDYCPQCRGIWLDHGELEKIVQREAPTDSETDMKRQIDPLMPPPGQGRMVPSERERWDDDDDDDYDSRGRRQKGREREGFFGSMMDIFD